VFGNRIQTDVTQGVTETVTRYGYDGWDPAKGPGVGGENWQVWAQLDGSSSLTNRYLNGDQVDQVFAQIAGSGGGALSWLWTDHLGSVVGETSGTGTLQLTMTYDAFGTLTHSTTLSGSPMPVVYDWDDLQFDAVTSLIYDRARFYDQGTGRALSQDPEGLQAGDINPYVYANNDPTNDTDPSGMSYASTVYQEGAQKIFYQPEVWFSANTPVYIGNVQGDSVYRVVDDTKLKCRPIGGSSSAHPDKLLGGGADDAVLLVSNAKPVGSNHDGGGGESRFPALR
jgi:RHS repeat-associated protein